MLVDLSTRTLRIVVFRLSLCDLEVGAWDDDIARVCRSRPLLTVYTVAERSRGRLSCCNISCLSSRTTSAPCCTYLHSQTQSRRTCNCLSPSLMFTE